MTSPEPPQSAFRILPPELQAMALVGHYLQSFALMEAQINQTIGKALKLDGMQTIIVCKNIQFRDKQKILRTLVNTAYLTEEERTHYNTELTCLVNMAADRNMVAHELFMAPESGDGVEFLVSKAAGKLQFPEVRWTIDQVEEKSSRLLAMIETLKALQGKLSGADLIRALVLPAPDDGPALTQPTEPLLSQRGLLAGLPPFPSAQDYPLQETADATPPETPEELRE